MAEYDPYSVLTADEPTAKEMAMAYAAQLRGQRGLGLLGQASGDRVLSQVGTGLVAGAQRGNDQLGQEAGERLKMALQRQQTAKGDAQLAEIVRHNKATENQDSWAAVSDASGGTVMFNRKTGEFRPLNPLGPGQRQPLKPSEMEHDVQSLGKDLEDSAKMSADVTALKVAAAKGDVPGFGPIEGRLPDMLTPNDGIALRQSAGRLMANIMHQISGSAVSESEVTRQLEAMGLGRTATPAAFKAGVTSLENQYRNLIAQREAKYRPEVVNEYSNRGGFTSHSLPSDSGPHKISSDAEFNALPSGAEFIGPDGKHRRKP
jgi:hypothetical protein